MKKKEFIFIISNVIIFLFIIYLSSLFYKSLIWSLALYLGIYLPFGLEFIISSIFSFILKLNFSYKVVILSFIINVPLLLLYFKLFDWLYISLFCINQIAGIKFGELLRTRAES